MYVCGIMSVFFKLAETWIGCLRGKVDVGLPITSNEPAFKTTKVFTPNLPILKDVLFEAKYDTVTSYTPGSSYGYTRCCTLYYPSALTSASNSAHKPLDAYCQVIFLGGFEKPLLKMISGTSLPQGAFITSGQAWGRTSR